jgi:rod shape-determining protein MreC
VPRQPTARLPRLERRVRRYERPSFRDTRRLKARLVAVVLVLVSLGLITVYFRESSDGALHEAQRIGLSVLMPFEVAGERVSRPFRNAWNYTTDLFGAKSENERLREEVSDLQEELIRERTEAEENRRLFELSKYISGPAFPDDYRAVVTRVVARPPSAYNQVVLVAAGSGDGVTVNAPVVTEDGLVGLVTEVTSNGARITLLTDQASAVSALVLQSNAAGVVRHGPSDGSALVLDRVGKEELVSEGDLVITAGWRTGNLESLYPRGIPIGTVASVGQQDVDLYKRIQIAPLVDFDSLAEVIILIENPPAKGKKTEK